MAWERFNAFIKTSPNLAFQDPILLQHFYVGLNRKTSRRRNMALGGSFLHVSANSGRNILTKIIENTPEEVEKKPLEEKPQIAKPELLPNPSPTLAISNPEPPKRRKLQFWILCLNSRMNFLMNTEIPRITIL